FDVSPDQRPNSHSCVTTNCGTPETTEFSRHPQGEIGSGSAGPSCGSGARRLFRDREVERYLLGVAAASLGQDQGIERSIVTPEGPFQSVFPGRKGVGD